LTDWIDEIDSAIDFVEDADHRAQILLRFEAQYLPALRNAKNQQQVWRAWEAFHWYLTTRATRRKPFELSGGDADRIIAAAIDILHLPPHEAP
jgi:ABC-type dipeptide/oligopeptide/nickel transport system ATPase subunit